MRDHISFLLLKNPNLGRIFSNAVWLSVDRLRLVITLFLGAWMARSFGPELFGALNYATALVGLVAIAAEVGLESVLVRELVRRPEDERQLLGTVFRMRIIAGSILYGGFLLCAFQWVGDRVELRLLWIMGALVFSPALWTTRAWFQARLENRRLVHIQLSICIGFGILRGLFLVLRRPIWELAGLVVAEQLAGGLALLIDYQREQKHAVWERFDRSLAYQLLRESWPLILSGFAVTIYMRIDQVMLQHLAGTQAGGLYAAAAKLSEAWYFIPAILTGALFPSIVRSRTLDRDLYLKRFQQYLSLSALLAYLVSVPVALLSPLIVHLVYGTRYDASAPILAVHIWSSAFVFLGVAREQFLVNEGLLKFSLFATTLGGLLNVLLNLWLIPLYSGTGAALATLISYAAAAVATSFLHPDTRSFGWLQLKALVLPGFGLQTFFARKE